VIFLLRPIVLAPHRNANQAVVPVLIDTSQSMRLNDADGQTRLAQAAALVNQLLPSLSQQFDPQLFSVGEGLEPTRVERLTAKGRWSDLTGALAAVRERYHGQRVAGIVVLTDGGDTGDHGADPVGGTGPPVFAIGIGSVEKIHDREVTGMVAGE